MPIQTTIDTAFSFKKSAIGVADIGRDYFSQAIEIMACCHEIDIEGRPDLFPKLREAYLAVQDALNAATAKGSRNQSPAIIHAAFERAWDLLKEPDLNLHVEEIQVQQDCARENDVKTQARQQSIMKQYEIRKAHPPGKDVNVKINLDARQLAGWEDWICTGA
ncbi:hypothetical protein FIBSPDRAFT_1051772 [Athelia psychrophila]|uniref:Uncharacterized protein n=1 Tax=Athelia psychrophila TaxID=1759441 RepID=A0A165YHA9_9AGAM|nr:hypothetical protein FIBSPDRAFT_1051772 [Fibularhizoctonia sp. CBS 109695]